MLYCGAKWVNFLCPKCPQTRINADFYLSTNFIVGKIRMSLNPSLQCPTNAYFSGFFAFRDSTEIYVFLLFFVPIGTKLVQDWYKIGTKIVPQDPAIIILLQPIQDWYENAVSRLFNVISIFNLKCSFFLCPSFLNIFFYQLHQLFGSLNLFLSLDLSSYIKIIIITGMSYFF